MKDPVSKEQRDNRIFNMDFNYNEKITEMTRKQKKNPLKRKGI